MRKFGSESANLKFTAAALTTARTQVLDYFTQQRKDIADDHILYVVTACGCVPSHFLSRGGCYESALPCLYCFDMLAMFVLARYRFEVAKGFGDSERRLYEQLCDQIGFDKSPEILPLYMTGEDSVLIDNYPEIGFFRDIV